jgi:cysteine desulfurase
MNRCYLDHATTTPVDPRVREAMWPFLDDRFGSPSAIHRRGREARAAIETARAAVAALVDCPGEEIVFTASATEANNLAVKGTALASPGGGRILAAATEHISILHPLRTLARTGFEVVLLPVDKQGRLEPATLQREARRGDLLVTVAQASAEIGTLQPIAELVRIARAAGVPLHCDAAATSGLVPLPGIPSKPPLLTLTPHLFGGPQGVAALRVETGHSLRPLIEGGIQEAGLRPGTPSVAAIAGFGRAADIVRADRAEKAAAATRLAGDFKTRLSTRLEGVEFTGDPGDRLPGHVSLCVRGAEAEALLRDLDAAGIEAASGSACTTEVGKPSHVLLAIGLDPVLARGALTFMFGAGNGPEDPLRAADALTAAVSRIRGLSPLERGTP